MPHTHARMLPVVCKQSLLRPWHRLWRQLGAAAALAALLAAAPAQAQDAPYAEVQRLMGAEQLPQALQTAEAWLADKPKDPQMRFLKGLIQSQQGQSEAAQQTFILLTQDYPELPEPYNNLAVLYAAAKRYDQARIALETALQLNPAYATAHQNLGDVYAQLAAQAYTQALTLAPENPALSPKIKALQTVLSNTPATAASKAGLPPPGPSGW